MPISDYLPPVINNIIGAVAPSYKKAIQDKEWARRRGVAAAKDALETMSRPVVKKGRVYQRTIDKEQKARLENVLKKHDIQPYKAREAKIAPVRHMLSVAQAASYLPVIGVIAQDTQNPLYYTATALHMANIGASAIGTGNYKQGLQRLSQAALPVIVSIGVGAIVSKM